MNNDILSDLTAIIYLFWYKHPFFNPTVVYELSLSSYEVTSAWFIYLAICYCCFSCIVCSLLVNRYLNLFLSNHVFDWKSNRLSGHHTENNNKGKSIYFIKKRIWCEHSKEYEIGNTARTTSHVTSFDLWTKTEFKIS